MRQTTGEQNTTVAAAAAAAAPQLAQLAAPQAGTASLLARPAGARLPPLLPLLWYFIHNNFVYLI